MPAAEDFQWARQKRATVRAAGGVLDLVLPLRVGSDGPALFCAHPIVGLSWCYRALLPHLDERHPVYGLQPRGLRRPEPLPATMAEMARDYADQMRLTQPEGPYHLLGWSLGGNIAFAVAEELERRGCQVGLLTILDAAPTFPDSLTASDSDAWLLYNFVLDEFGYDPALVAEDPEPEMRLLELVRRRPGLGLADWAEWRTRALLRVVRNNVAVTRGHRLGQVRCPVLFISATRLARPLEQKLAAWQPFISQPIEVVEVDCLHRYLLLPQSISVIGPAVTERLARAAVPAG
ncbi:MAG TPA: alpha/beta fold hydrolase [Jatrophihabitans sp.]|uniref:alpha/beta fold hydrolase n=1 Tax=Jatrophihabitans sp. TaxID=1932789 RepID=UPI002F006253